MLSLPLAFLSALALSILTTVIYRLFFHPLAQVPGPSLAGVSTVWLAWNMRKAKTHVWQPELHKNYGPVVRVAPNEVIICSEDAAHTIYGAGSPFVKGPWYAVCKSPSAKYEGEERLDLIAEMDRNLYLRQRRAIGPAYSVAGVEKHEGLINSYIDTYVARLRAQSEQWIDLSEWMHIYALDSLGVVTLGSSPGYAQKGHDGGNMVASDKLWAYFTVVGFFPWISFIAQAFPIISKYLTVLVVLGMGLSIPTGFPIFAFVVPKVMERLASVKTASAPSLPADRPGSETTRLFDGKKKREDQVDTDGKDNDEADSKAGIEEGDDEDLLGSLLATHTKKVDHFPLNWIMHIALTNFGAGHDTMTVTLSAVIYHLASNRSALSRLTDELRDAGVKKETSFREVITRVPYLTACVKEAMRLTPAIGMHLQRVVPQDGYTPHSSTVYLPPGTHVGVNPWALHHSSAIFPEPEVFRPERWLHDGSEDGKREVGRLEQSWLGFGGGSRSCPGQNLARVLMVKLLVRLLVAFDVEVKGEPEFIGWFSVQSKKVDIKFIEKVI